MIERCRVVCVVAAIGLLVWMGVAGGQALTDSAKAAHSRALEETFGRDVSSGIGEPASSPLYRSLTWPELDESTRAEVLRTVQAQVRYDRWTFDHTRRVFVWQLISSVLIFVVVIALVALGIYFSAVQFNRGMAAPPDAKPEPGPPTELEVSMRGIRVSSTTLGVVILVISFMFFYLYLANVYKISTVH